MVERLFAFPCHGSRRPLIRRRVRRWAYTMRRDNCVPFVSWVERSGFSRESLYSARRALRKRGSVRAQTSLPSLRPSRPRVRPLYPTIHLSAHSIDHARWMQMARTPFYEGFCHAAWKDHWFPSRCGRTAAPADAEGLARDPLCWNAWLKSAVTSSLPTLLSVRLRAAARSSRRRAW